MHNESKKVKSHTKSTLVIYLRALFITNLFLQTKQFSSITSRMFYNETGSLLKLSQTLAKPGLGDSLHQHASSHCVSTTIFGCQKHACGPHPLYVPNMAPCELFLLHEFSHNYKGIISIMSLKFKYTRQPPYIQFQKVTSKNGRNTRLIA
jgi:hypothetical protein